jgi:hypothetical protein
MAGQLEDVVAGLPAGRLERKELQEECIAGVEWHLKIQAKMLTRK